MKLGVLISKLERVFNDYGDMDVMLEVVYPHEVYEPIGKIIVDYRDKPSIGERREFTVLRSEFSEDG